MDTEYCYAKITAYNFKAGDSINAEFGCKLAIIEKRGHIDDEELTTYIGDEPNRVRALEIENSKPKSIYIFKKDIIGFCAKGIWNRIDNSNGYDYLFDMEAHEISLYELLDPAFDELVKRANKKFSKMPSTDRIQKCSFITKWKYWCDCDYYGEYDSGMDFMGFVNEKKRGCSSVGMSVALAAQRPGVQLPSPPLLDLEYQY